MKEMILISIKIQNKELSHTQLHIIILLVNNNENNNIKEYNDNRSDNESPIIDNINNMNNDNDEAFRNAIATWSLKYIIRHNACNALIKILQEHTSCKFFNDARTLLKTPRQTEILKICEGEFFYLGLSDIIRSMLLKSNFEHIHLLLNVDLPLSKSSNASLWPILISNTMQNDVYIVGAYFGHKKPDDSNAFLQFLVDDLIHLINEGYIYNNKVIKISLCALICDAPAKSFVLYTKGHTGFYSCTKCTIKGKYIRSRICFPNGKYSLRTDELFSMNAYKNFQIGYSVLNNVPGFLPISSTPLDYMHSIRLGVVKKMILLWIKGPLSVRLNRRAINKILHLLLLIKSSTPKEFVRKPRPISDIKHWKAVEFRSFLLYVGPTVLRHILKKKSI